jgi:hypothetical protein
MPPGIRLIDPIARHIPLMFLNRSDECDDRKQLAAKDGKFESISGSRKH